MSGGSDRPDILNIYLQYKLQGGAAWIHFLSQLLKIQPWIAKNVREFLGVGAKMPGFGGQNYNDYIDFCILYRGGSVVQISTSVVYLSIYISIYFSTYLSVCL